MARAMWPLRTSVKNSCSKGEHSNYHKQAVLFNHLDGRCTQNFFPSKIIRQYSPQGRAGGGEGRGEGGSGWGVAYSLLVSGCSEMNGASDICRTIPER